MILALTGSPNCGKTTLFNALTGSRQHVGNFPGVTVERKSGFVRGSEDCELVDLPGIYALRPYTREELVTRDFLLRRPVDCVISVADAASAERSLYLTLQLLELRVPVVLALNRMDELRRCGGRVDTEGLAGALGIPVVPISAARGEGLDELLRAAADTARRRRLPGITEPGETENALRRCRASVLALIRARAKARGLPPRFCAARLMEGEEEMVQLLGLDERERDALTETLSRAEKSLGTDLNAALAGERYRFIEQLVKRYFVRGGESPAARRSQQLDRLLTGKYTALPMFCALMLTVFFLTFGGIGGALSDALAAWLRQLSAMTGTLLARKNVSPVLRSLITDGILPGVSCVLGFLPVILTLFFFLSLLEDSGYMARVAFIMDRPLRRIGLSGRSLVPLLMGFGCTVPAVMAARTVSSDRDRKMTVLLTPFVSCSAKMPVYAVFCAAFFPRRSAAVMLGLCLFALLTGLLAALLLKGSLFRGEVEPFLLELPDYRLPTLRSVGLLLWEKLKDFLERAFTILLLSSAAIWFLQRFDGALHSVSDSTESLLSLLGRAVAPVFRPLGFGDWRAAAALCAGLTAKEAVISTLAVALGCDPAGLGTALRGVFTPRSALSFLIFTLLYSPCAASAAAMRRELGSRWQTAAALLGQSAVAWLAALAVYTASAWL